MNLSASLPPKNDWAAMGVARRLDPETIGQADSVVIHLEKPGAEDALVAAGMALAKGVPTVLVAPERKHLPWFLQQADENYPSRVLITSEQPSPQAMAQLKPELPPWPNTRVDTFIGCLMSGLSPEQYAEGRSHLLEIHQTLAQDLGSPNNYCEGIKVGNPQTFDQPKKSLEVDMEAVQASQRCLFYQYDNSSRPSGMWVELGAALAWGKPCTLLVPDLQGVPASVRQGLPHLKLIQYGNHEHLLNSLKSDPNQLV